MNLSDDPSVKVPSRGSWQGQMVKEGAEISNPAYKLLIDHYNIELGVKDAAAGLDQEMKDEMAPLIGHAAVGLAGILDSAFDEAEVEPPKLL